MTGHSCCVESVDCVVELRCTVDCASKSSPITVVDLTSLVIVVLEIVREVMLTVIVNCIIGID